MKYPERTPNLSWAAGLIPSWIEAEMAYARQKFINFPNLQRSALSGGLLPGGMAHRDFDNYLGRFLLFHNQSRSENQDETLSLQASSALGKFVNAGVALNSVLIENKSGLTTAQADEATITQLFRICSSMEQPVMPNLDEFASNFDNKLANLAELIAGGSVYDSPALLSESGDILLDQVELFVAFCEISGVIAQPGVSSTAAVRPWRID